MVTCLHRRYSENRTGNASKFRLILQFFPFFFFLGGGGGGLKCNIDNDDKCNFDNKMKITSSFN